LCDAEPIVDWAAIGWIEVVEYTPAIHPFCDCDAAADPHMPHARRRLKLNHPH